jgi:hypothetical protein
MAFIRYVSKKFTPEHQEVIANANAICEEYDAQNLQLTLRQLYYQFVSRNLLANKQTEYKRLGSILNDARMAGEMDWDYLIDRTRNVVKRNHWDSPSDLIEDMAKRYHRDLWAPQKRRIEVWVEKDAAIGVIENVCRDNSVSYFSCRGYTSVSELWAAAQRVRYHLEEGEQVTILHIGDHDPSGIDMTRDMEDRLRTFISRDWLGTWAPHLRGAVTRGQIHASMREHMRANGSYINDNTPPWNLKRIALNYDQVEEYQPPPNPAKQTDSRFQRYMEDTGLDESWELDALDPFVLQDLIQDEIDAARNDNVWSDSNLAMEQERQVLQAVGSHWADVVTQFGTQEGSAS